MLSIGAGFYLNATQAPWDKNWKMYDYVAKELPEVVSTNLPIVSFVVVSQISSSKGYSSIRSS